MSRGIRASFNGAVGNDVMVRLDTMYRHSRTSGTGIFGDCVWYIGTVCRTWRNDAFGRCVQVHLIII